MLSRLDFSWGPWLRFLAVVLVDLCQQRLCKYNSEYKTTTKYTLGNYLDGLVALLDIWCMTSAKARRDMKRHTPELIIAAEKVVTQHMPVCTSEVQKLC